MRQTSRSRVFPPTHAASRYLAAIAVTAGATLARRLLDPVLHDEFAFITFYPAVAAAARLGGIGPALLTATLGFFIAQWSFIPPRGSWTVFGEGPAVGLAVYAFMSALIAWLAGGMRNARQRAEQELVEKSTAFVRLEESERRFRVLADSAPVLIWMTGTEAGCTYFNRRWLEYTGRPLEAELGDGWADLLHPDDRKRRLEVFSSSFEARAPFSVEYRLRRHDGGYRWFLDHGVPRVQTDGTFLGYIGSCVDISERKEAEESLARHRTLLQVTLRSIGDAVVATDATGRVTFINAVAEDLTGWPADQAIGKPLEDVFVILNEISRNPVENPVEKVIRLGRVVGLANHTILVSKNGSERPIEDSAAPIITESNELLGVVLVFRDASERRRTERALRESETRYRSVVDTVLDGIITIDEAGVIQTVNPAAESIFGYSAAEMIGSDVTCLMPAPYKDEHNGYVERYLLTGERRIIGSGREVEGQRSDGSVFPMELAVTELLLDGRRLFTGLVRDISERKRTEEHIRLLALAGAELSEHQARDQLIRTLVQLTTPQFADRCLVELHGENDGTGGSPSPDSHAASDDRPASRIRLPLSRDRSAIGEITFIRGSHRPPFDKRDVDFATDLTKRVEVAMENTRLYDELLDANLRKEEFLAMLAHELRNPLGAISNAVQVVHQPGASPEHLKNAADVIARQSKNLSRMVDDLLDVSRITRGTIQLRKELVDLSRVVRRAATDLESLLRSRNHEFFVSIPDESLLAEADPTRIEQIVANLLSNAARYTDDGGKIWLSLERRDGEATLRVRDTGRGIPPELARDIFAPFSQVDHGLDRTQGGLGLGLTIVRSLAELHGGSVSVASDGAGHGSEFSVRLPLATGGPVQPDDDAESESTARERGSTESTGRPRRVLVVDDNLDLSQMLAILLRTGGYEVEVAHDGPVALDVARRFHPDAAILDIGLPGMNGYELASALRRQIGKNVILIALSGYGQAEDRRHSAEAGFDHHLVKPVRIEDLSRLLGEAR